MHVILIAALAWTPGTLAAQAVAEQYDALKKEYAAAEQQALDAGREAARSDEERQKLQEEKLKPVVRRYAGRFLEFARNNPGDPAALDALVFVIAQDWEIPEMDQATDLLLGRYVSSDNLAKVCKYLVISPARGADQFLKAVGDKNPQRDMQAFARYCSTRRLHEQAKRLVPANPAEADRMDQAAEQQFERLGAEFGDVRLPAVTPPELLSDAIKKDLFEIRHLSVGKPAPEIESEDVDGKPMKLSDQRGKVVMLVFWGYWCGDCRAMLPHERAIAKRMESKPFVLIGVNSDRSRDVVKKAREKEHITWRSWWDDGTRRGRISSAWNIHFWPTIYVIDAKGIIRYKDVTRQALDDALDSLVKEAR